MPSLIGLSCAGDAPPPVKCSSMARQSFVRVLNSRRCFCDYAATPMLDLAKARRAAPGAKRSFGNWQSRACPTVPTVGLSSSREAAVDHECGCSYVRGFVRGKPKHWIGKFLRSSPPLQHAGGDQFIDFGSAKPIDVEWCPRKARADCIHPHPVPAFLEGEGARQREQSGLGRVVSPH